MSIFHTKTSTREVRLQALQLVKKYLQQAKDETDPKMQQWYIDQAKFIGKISQQQKEYLE